MKNLNRIKAVKTSFSGGNLTNYSGIYPLFKFMKKMRLNNLFEQRISLVEKSNQKYSLNGPELSVASFVIQNPNMHRKKLKS